MDIANITGFNYDGSWGTSGLDVWMHHDHGTMAVEIARGKRHFPGWNVGRWWLSDEAFYRNPERFLANFEAGLSIFASHDILVVPVLFNRWRDPVCDFGGVPLEFLVTGLCNMAVGHDFEGKQFTDPESPWQDLKGSVERNHRRYLEQVVGPHKDDPRIILWDLCNEPLMGPYADDHDHFITRAELRWLKWLYESCRAVGATHPLSIGSYFNLNVLKLIEPWSDVINFHPYYQPKAGEWGKGHRPNATREGFLTQLDKVVDLGRETGKPLYASETVWGAATDEERVEQIHFTLSALKERDVGFTIHALHHSLIADLHYPEYGPTGMPEVMHFIDPDGSVRPGHDAFNQYA